MSETERPTFKLADLLEGAKREHDAWPEGGASISTREAFHMELMINRLVRERDDLAAQLAKEQRRSQVIADDWKSQGQRDEKTISDLRMKLASNGIAP